MNNKEKSWMFLVVGILTSIYIIWKKDFVWGNIVLTSLFLIIGVWGIIDSWKEKKQDEKIRTVKEIITELRNDKEAMKKLNKWMKEMEK